MNNKQTLAVASTSVLAAGMAHGSILYQGGQYSTPINYQITPSTSYTLDLDADAVIDYSVAFDGAYASKPVVTSVGQQNPNAWVLAGANTNAPITPFGATIGFDYEATNPINGSGYLYENGAAVVVGPWSSSAVTSGYVGLEFTDQTTVTNYGWVHLIYNGVSNPQTVTIVDYAYETTPNKAIVCGATQDLGAPIIYTGPVSQTNTANSTVQFNVQALAAPAPTYQWLAGSGGVYTNLPENGHFSGTTTATLTVATLTAADMLDYQVIVSNSLGTATSAPPAHLTVVGAVVGKTIPASEIIYAGMTAQFSVTNETSSLTMTNRWLKDGAPLTDGGAISGSGTTNLKISNLNATNLGNYQLVVDVGNGYAPVTSSVSPLSIVARDGSLAETNMLLNFTNGLVNYYRLSETTAASGGGVVAYDYVGGINGLYGVDALDNVAGPTAAVGFPGFVSTNTGISLTSSSDQLSTVRVSPWNLNTNTVTITAWINPTQNQVSGAGVVTTRAGGVVAGIHYYGTVQGNGDYCLGYNWNDNGGTWGWTSGLTVPQNQWSFIALVITPTSGTIYVINTNGVASALNAVANANCPWNQIESIGSDPSTGVFVGGIDEVGVFNKSLSLSQLLSLYAGGLNVPGIAPVITGQPANVTVSANGTANFSVSAYGTATLTYQWQFQSGGAGPFVNLNNTAFITGATNGLMSIANVNGANLGNYQVVVTNSGGAVTSSVASLGLNAIFTKVARMSVKFAPNQNNNNCYINGTRIGGAGMLNTTNWYNWAFGSGSASLGYFAGPLFYTAPNFSTNLSTCGIVDYHKYGNTQNYNVNVPNQYNNVALLNSAVQTGTGIATVFTNLDPVFATNGYSVYIYFDTSPGKGDLLAITNFSGNWTNTSVVGSQVCSLFPTTNWNGFVIGGQYIGTNLPSYLQGTSIFVQGAYSTNLNNKGLPAFPAWETQGANYIVFTNCPPSTSFALYHGVDNYSGWGGIEIVATAPPGSIQVNGPFANTATPYVGANLNLTCTTAGTAPYTWSWQKGPDGVTWTNIPGATSQSFSVSSVTTNASGYYQMIFTANSVAVTSAVQQVTVYTQLPTIGAATASPSNTVNQASTVTFSAPITAAGAPPYSYQWMISPDGVTYTNWPFATTMPVSLVNVPTNASGNRYECVYTAGTISVTSAPVTLTVQPLSISNAIVFPNQTIYVGGAAELVCSNFLGLGSYSFQWQKCNTPTGTYTNIAGATGNSMVVAGAQTTDSGYYQCVFTAANGSVASGAVHLAVLTPGGPLASMAIKFAPGYNSGLSAVTNTTYGAGVLNTTNWNNLGGSGSVPFYDLNGVKVTSQAGIVTYSGGTVGFVNDGTPINSTNNNMALLNGNIIVGGNAPVFVITNLDPVFNNGFKVIYYEAGSTAGSPLFGGQFTVTSYAGTMTNSPIMNALTWSIYGTNILVTQGADWTAPNVFVQGVYSNSAARTTWETPFANYLVYSNFTGGSVFLSSPSGSYQGPAAVEIVATKNGSGLAATASTLTSSTNYAPLGTSVTFTNTVSGAPQNGDYVMFLDGQTVLGYTTVNGGIATLTTSALAEGNHNITAAYAGNGTNAQGSTSAVLTYFVVSGTQSITAPVVSPSSGVVVGANVTITCATYTGMPAYSFQWEHSGNGVTYTNVGGNANSLALNAVTLNDAGYYQLVYTANGNAITSSVAQLTVYVTPSIGAAVASPASTVNQATVVTISCTTNGGAPVYGLQWQTGPDGITYTNIPGATLMPLALGAVTVANTGYYQCIYTANGLSVTSAPVLLTVNAVVPPPVFTYTAGGGSLVLTWNSGVLLEATSLLGPWTTNVGATSPFTNSTTGAEMFYRIKE